MPVLPCNSGELFVASCVPLLPRNSAELFVASGLPLLHCNSEESFGVPCCLSEIQSGLVI